MIKPFTAASANQTSAAFDCWSKTPVLVQAAVTGATLTAGTIKAETSLDGTNFDTTTAPFSLTYQNVANAIIQELGYGFPLVRFKIASLAFTYGKTQTGTGLSDVTVAGTYTALTAHSYVVKISTAAATDKFRWSKDDGAFSAEISMTGSAQTIADGMTVQFGATTGHTLNDLWTITPASIDLTVIS